MKNIFLRHILNKYQFSKIISKKFFMIDENLEEVAIVDENNNVIGSENRKKMRELRLIHRSTYILVLNSKNEFHVHKSNCFFFIL